MELDPVQRFGRVLDRRDRRVVTAGGDAVSGRRDIHVVPVAHPDGRLLALAEPEEQSAAFHPDVGAAVLPAVGASDVPAGEVRHQLHPVAEPQDRRAETEQLRVGRGHVVVVDRVGPAGQDDALGLPLPDPLHRARRRMDLAVDMRLAHPARDELGVL